MDARAGKDAEALINEGLAEPIFRRGGRVPAVGEATGMGASLW